MSSSEYETDDLPVVTVLLNISESNATVNGSRGRILEKTPKDDTSVNNIILGIGVVVVSLIFLLIIIKLFYKCYKLCKEVDDDETEKTKDKGKKSPLLPTTNVVRRNSSIRNPLAPIRRSSLHIETQMELRQKRLSQPYEATPPSIKRP